jgi:hypothetical protein
MIDSFSIHARLPIANCVGCLLDGIGVSEAWDPQAGTAMIRGTLQQLATEKLPPELLDISPGAACVDSTYPGIDDRLR